jgi:hypothetical protein
VHPDLVASLDASLKLTLADILALSQCDVQRLAVNHALIHLGNSLAGLLGAREADKTESFGLSETGFLLLFAAFNLLAILLFSFWFFSILTFAFFHIVTHNLGRGNGSIRSKLLAETLIIDLIIQILNVPIDI